MLHAIGVCIAHARNRKCQVLGLPFASSIELIPELVSYATSVKCEIKANASVARISPQAAAKINKKMELTKLSAENYQNNAIKKEVSGEHSPLVS